jgi:hypothetical protein
MYEQFGDKRAAGLIDTCIETMSQIVSDWRGQVVKTIGDEVMASFDDAASACEAAKAMQAAIETFSQSGPHPLAIRIGFHFGSVPTAARIRLTLQVAERTLEFVDGATPIWMGRDPGCEIIVHERMASRRHARIERRGDRFYLVDESTNGTYVKLADGLEILLRLEALQLRGAGQISLGAPTKEAADLVHFRD